MKVPKFKKHIGMVCLVSLAGCNIGSKEDLSPEFVSNDEISAYDSLHSVLPNQIDYVDLQADITSSSSLSTELSSVYLVYGSEILCGEPIIKGIGFEVLNKGELCEYQYAIENQSGSIAQGKASVISSLDGKAELSPISEATVTGLSPIINVSLPSGYSLMPDIQLLGGGMVTEVDAVNNTITYEATEIGYHRIIYVAQNLSFPSDLKTGQIDISVSEASSFPPLATEYQYPDEINTEELITVDISENISSPDNYDLQLLYVNSNNALVQPTNTNDLLNTKFDFVTSQGGLHYVNYVISDHHGGYASSSVTIQVADPKDRGLWRGIVSHGAYFTPPLTASEASDASHNSSSSNEENRYEEPINVATYTLEQATEACSHRGRLPTTQELVFLTEYNPSIDNDWPIEIAYLASDGNSVQYTVSSDLLNNEAEINTYNSQTLYYLTCIDAGGLSVDSYQSSAYANGQDTASLSFLVKDNETPVSGLRLDFQVTGNGELDKYSGVTDEFGYVVVQATNERAEKIEVSAQYIDSQRIVNRVSANVDFIGDNNTSTIDPLNGLTLIKNGAASNGVDENIIDALVTDAFSHPVRNAPVIVQTENNDVIPHSNVVQTDDEGIARILLTKRSGSQSGHSNVNISHENLMLETSQESVGVYFGPKATDIIVDGYILQRPPLYSEAPDGSKHWEGEDWSMLEYDDAVAYCNSQTNIFTPQNKILPSELALQHLYNLYPGNIEASAGWPDNYDYRVNHVCNDNDDYCYVDLKTGQTETNSYQSGFSYVACMENSIFPEGELIVGDGLDLNAEPGIISITAFNEDLQIVPEIDIHATIINPTGNATIVDTIKTTDSEGKADFEILTTNEESVEVKFEYGSFVFKRTFQLHSAPEIEHIFCGTGVGDSNNNATNSCLKAVRVIGGKVFTSTPSENWLAKYNYVESSSDSSRSFISLLTEDGTNGPSGQFARFTYLQAEAHCDYLSTLNYGGYDEWAVPTAAEQTQLYNATGGSYGLYYNYLWPIGKSYRNIGNSGQSNLDYKTGIFQSVDRSTGTYGMCVSR
ncbi:Ig-like domain-containing protein [Vibrio sp. CyArs1]|uniref:Ig-like domain-containing protein n=1 Tax=Vibrio sp. CyArs1 TaxID=2682577 RepID=UPI001F05A6A0|nr:Ig-like domain-containing protein [Vibrio sp. CyArs1]